MTKLYIAYGSNMDEKQMAYRCPDASLVGTGAVEGYRLLFKGRGDNAYATIEPEKGSRVPVLVWAISEADERSLDRYEGYPRFYYKKEIPAEAGGETRNGMVYIMDEHQKPGKASSRYYGVLEGAYRKFGFPMEILTEAYEASGGNRKGDF